MKTTEAFFKQQTTEQCQSTLKPSSWLHSSLRGLLSPALKNRLSLLSARVRRALAAIPAALKSDRRRFVGILLIAVVPLIEVAYRFMDQTPIASGSYWSPYWYVFEIGRDVSMISLATAFFLLMPERDKVRFMTLVPIAYKMAKVLYILFLVNSDEAYHNFIPQSFLLVGLVVGAIWLFIAEYLINLHYHKRTRPVTTLLGAVKCRAISDAKYRELSEKELETLKSLN